MRFQRIISCDANYKLIAIQNNDSQPYILILVSVIVGAYTMFCLCVVACMFEYMSYMVNKILAWIRQIIDADLCSKCGLAPGDLISLQIDCPELNGLMNCFAVSFVSLRSLAPRYMSFGGTLIDFYSFHKLSIN